MSQLHSQPLWITGDRPKKDFQIVHKIKENLPESSTNVKIKKANESIHASAQLVKHLEELKIADHIASDDEENNEAKVNFITFEVV